MEQLHNKPALWKSGESNRRIIEFLKTNSLCSENVCEVNLLKKVFELDYIAFLTPIETLGLNYSSFSWLLNIIHPSPYALTLLTEEVEKVLRGSKTLHILDGHSTCDYHGLYDSCRGEMRGYICVNKIERVTSDYLVNPHSSEVKYLAYKAGYGNDLESFINDQLRLQSPIKFIHYFTLVEDLIT